MTPSLRHSLVWALGTPFFEGNRVDILRNGIEIFPAMLTAIDGAEKTVDFLTFIYWSGEAATRFAEALAGAAQRGVRVRVLLDGVGSLPIEPPLLERMEEAGVAVHWFRPLSRWQVLGRASHRTHRKILVCDRTLGFTGGVGIGSEWEGDARGPDEWRDTHFRVRGPAVQGLHAAFVENWLEAAGSLPIEKVDEPLAPAGPAAINVVRASGGVGWSDRATLLRTLVSQARRSIRLSSPYFVPDQHTSLALREAVGRGASVDVLVPGPYVDHRVAQLAGEDVYERLLEGGVRIWRYRPTMIHQKIGVFDSELVSIGSGNLNQRSMMQDDEIQLVVADEDFATEIDAMLDRDFELGDAIAPGTWQRRSVLQRLGELVVRPFRRQM